MEEMMHPSSVLSNPPMGFEAVKLLEAWLLSMGPYMGEGLVLAHRLHYLYYHARVTCVAKCILETV